MLLLAFESSAAAASVALTEDGELRAQSFQRTGLTHSATLLPMAEDLLKNAGYDVSQIDAVAAAAGPGSFTGVRIGMAAAMGLSWSLSVPIASVSTLEAMAWMFESFSGTVCAVMDARRQQVYRAIFELKGGEPARLCDDDAVSLAELEEELSSVKNDILLVGDGALLCYNSLKSSLKNIRPAPEHLLYQTAWGVARCALEHKELFTPAGDARISYHRLSQAERERLARLEKGDT